MKEYVLLQQLSNIKNDLKKLRIQIRISHVVDDMKHYIVTEMTE